MRTECNECGTFMELFHTVLKVVGDFYERVESMIVCDNCYQKNEYYGEK